MKPLELPGLVTKGDRSAWALTSEDNRYRYALGRAWDPAPTIAFEAVRPWMLITMMNPSTARHDESDPTLDKVIHFAKQEGCGGVIVRNLFGYSSTDPEELRHVPDPVGPRNLEVLALDTLFGLRVAAWGNFPTWRVREKAKASFVGLQSRYGKSLHVFGLNKTGEPKHPLYLANKTRLAFWRELTP